MNINSDDQRAYDAGVAAGVIVRKFADGTLGDMSPEEMFAMSTDVALDTQSVSDIMGMSRDNAAVIDPEVFRERLMDQYDLQRASDLLVNGIESYNRERDRQVNARRDSILRYARASVGQAERVAFDEGNGDLSAVNRMREIYFFE